MRYEKTIKGTTYYIEPDKAWWVKHWKKVAGAFAAVGVALLLFGCNAGVSSTTPEPATFACQGTYVGNVDMPPHEERIIARNIGLERKGLPLTGNDALDNAAQGGGSPDGGMYLTGDFNYEADASCNVKGKVSIFGYPFDLTGQVQPDGKFTLSYLVPLFVGQVNADNSITGKLMHGGGEEFIYGYLNGKFTPK